MNNHTEKIFIFKSTKIDKVNKTAIGAVHWISSFYYHLDLLLQCSWEERFGDIYSNLI